MHEITASLSMRYFGYYALARHGGICPQIMETGKIPIDAFADGETKVSGRGYWKL
jgi:hypothetical protein